jgi:hypothetical protein
MLCSVAYEERITIRRLKPSIGTHFGLVKEC